MVQVSQTSLIWRKLWWSLCDGRTYSGRSGWWASLPAIWLGETLQLSVFAALLHPAVRSTPWQGRSSPPAAHRDGLSELPEGGVGMSWNRDTPFTFCPGGALKDIDYVSKEWEKRPFWVAQSLLALATVLAFVRFAKDGVRTFSSVSEVLGHMTLKGLAGLRLLHHTWNLGERRYVVVQHNFWRNTRFQSSPSWEWILSLLAGLFHFKCNS